MHTRQLKSVTMEMYKSWIVNHHELFEKSVREFVQEHRPHAVVYAMAIGTNRIQMVAEYL